MRHSPPVLSGNRHCQVLNAGGNVTPLVWLCSLLLFVSSVVLLSGCERPKAPARGKTAKQFDAARALVHNGQFDNAIVQLDAFLNQHGTHHLAGRASFLRAKCELGRGEIEQAEVWFRRTMNDFPATEEASKAEYKLAVIDLLRDDLPAAHIKMKTIATQANGPYTPEAAAWVRRLDQRLQAAP